MYRSSVNGMHMDGLCLCFYVAGDYWLWFVVSCLLITICLCHKDNKRVCVRIYIYIYIYIYIEREREREIMQLVRTDQGLGSSIVFPNQNNNNYVIALCPSRHFTVSRCKLQK